MTASSSSTSTLSETKIILLTICFLLCMNYTGSIVSQMMTLLKLQQQLQESSSNNKNHDPQQQRQQEQYSQQHYLRYGNDDSNNSNNSNDHGSTTLLRTDPQQPAAVQLLPAAAVPVPPPPPPPTRHVLYCLSGNDTSFMREFQVSLKSVLLNAPMYNPLTIHIIADQDAYDALDGVFTDNRMLTTDGNDGDNKKEPPSFQLPNQITIETYNVQSRMAKWEKFVKERQQKAIEIVNPPNKNVLRHTIGAYLRLFADEVLPSDVDHVVYLDTDVVIMSNLATVWEQQINHDVDEGDDDEKLFYWGGREMCSGFLLLRPRHLPQIWDLYTNNATKFHNNFAIGDQYLLQVITKNFKGRVGFFTDEWDVSAMNGPWRHIPDNLIEARPNGVGYLHFNGGGESSASFFDGKRPIHYSNSTYWNLAKYYVDMPWNWVYYQISSRVLADGPSYYLELNHRGGNNNKKNDSRK